MLSPQPITAPTKFYEPQGMISSLPSQPSLSKGQLCDLAREKTGATGEHTGRRLRELSEEGILELQIRKRHVHYRLAEKVPTRF
jgi:hypothetical protein